MSQSEKAYHRYYRIKTNDEIWPPQVGTYPSVSHSCDSLSPMRKKFPIYTVISSSPNVNIFSWSHIKCSKSCSPQEPHLNESVLQSAMEHNPQGWQREFMDPELFPWLIRHINANYTDRLSPDRSGSICYVCVCVWVRVHACVCVCVCLRVWGHSCGVCINVKIQKAVSLTERLIPSLKIKKTL
jgi:hypothetical protein